MINYRTVLNGTIYNRGYGILHTNTCTATVYSLLTPPAPPLSEW